jgi:hypothetical protein
MLRYAALVLLGLSLAACALLGRPPAQGGPEGGSTRTAPQTPSIQATWQPPTAAGPDGKNQVTAIAAATLAALIPPTLAPSDTPTPLPVPQTQSDLDKLRQTLAQRVDSPEWARLGLPEDLDAHARAFVNNSETLSDADAQDLNAIVTQWQALEDLARRLLIPNEVGPVYQVYFYTGGAGGASTGQNGTPVVYARSGPPQAVPGSQALYMPVYPSGAQDSDPQGLLLAPVFAGLTQRISPDGRSIQYLDGRDRLVMVADGRVLDKRDAQGQTLLEKMSVLYDSNSPYLQASAFPRFVFPVDNVEAGFFGIDRSLSTSQILLLNETFHLFDRQALEPLKQIMFGPQVAIVILDKLKDAAGLNYSGTGVIVLDRRDLFGNKYQLAQVLAHEASHVLQGDLQSNGDICAQLLHREVGDKTIPPDFYNWDAVRLVEGIKNGEIGAYHTSLWMLTQLGIRDTAWLVKVIRSGTDNGKTLLVDCNQ